MVPREALEALFEPFYPQLEQDRLAPGPHRLFGSRYQRLVDHVRQLAFLKPGRSVQLSPRTELRSPLHFGTALVGWFLISNSAMCVVGTPRCPQCTSVPSFWRRPVQPTS